MHMLNKCDFKLLLRLHFILFYLKSVFSGLLVNRQVKVLKPALLCNINMAFRLFFSVMFYQIKRCLSAFWNWKMLSEMYIPISVLKRQKAFSRRHLQTISLMEICLLTCDKFLKWWNVRKSREKALFMLWREKCTLEN